MATDEGSATLIAKERTTTSTLDHYRAALNCLRALPKIWKSQIHKDELDLNLEIEFDNGECADIPITPKDFRRWLNVAHRLVYKPKVGFLSWRVQGSPE